MYKLPKGIAAPVLLFMILTIRATLVNIRQHVDVDILGANVRLSRQEELDILFGGVKDGRQSTHSDKLGCTVDARNQANESRITWIQGLA